MQRLLAIQRYPARLVLLIILALLAAVLALPAAAPGAAAPARQDQATPMGTNTPTPTATPDVPKPDAYEPNNTIGEARPVELGGTTDKLNFAPEGDVDYFVAFVKPDM